MTISPRPLLSHESELSHPGLPLPRGEAALGGWDLLTAHFLAPKCAQKRRIHYNRLVIRGGACRHCPWAGRTWCFSTGACVPCSTTQPGTRQG